MKKLGNLFAMCLITCMAIGQNNNGKGNTELKVISSTYKSGEGNMEVIEIKVVRPVINQIESYSLEIPGSKAAYLPLTRSSSNFVVYPGNSELNANETLTLTMDLDQYLDANGDLNVYLRPCCIVRPIMAIVVRSKGN